MFKKVHVLRVKPGEELLSEIKNYCQRNGISSGIILNIIGSVESIKLGIVPEYPGKYEYCLKDYNSPLSIVSGQGTIALMDNELTFHIHVSVSGHGVNEGGHLMEAKIWATGEVAIGELDYQLQRYKDPKTGLSVLQSTLGQ